MKLYSWGANTNGQLGHNFASEQISRPTEVKNELLSSLLSSPGSKVRIHGGGTQVLVSLTTPSAKSGPSTVVQLGVKSSVLKKSIPKDQAFEQIIIAGSDLRPTALSCGWEFNLILNEDGQVFSYGDNDKYGQLGRSSCPEECLSIPDFKARKISAGLRHAAAVSTEGHLYVWGDNTKGQFCSDAPKVIPQPLRLSAPPGINFVDVKCGKAFVLALDDQDQFWGCGSNKFGQLGPGGEPGTIGSLKMLGIQLPGKVLKFECGWSHTLVLLENHRCVTWGRNNFSQLGRALSVDANECDGKWDFVEGLHESVKAIACGSEHNVVLCDSGNVYAWGWNEHENCGVKSSRVSFCESSGAKLCEDCVLVPSIVGFGDDDVKIVDVACGNGNGIAVSL